MLGIRDCVPLRVGVGVQVGVGTGFGFGVVLVLVLSIQGSPNLTVKCAIVICIPI